jgi:hypothetical protein
MNAIGNLALKQGGSSDLVSASVTFNDQHIAGNEPPSFELTIRDFEIARVARVNPAALNVCHGDVPARISTRQPSARFLNAPSNLAQFLDVCQCPACASLKRSSGCGSTQRIGFGDRLSSQAASLFDLGGQFLDPRHDAALLAEWGEWNSGG